MLQKSEASQDGRPKTKVLLLGLGNDILSDDAIGLRIAAAVRERVADQNNVTVLESGEMGLALLDLIVGFNVLVIVDSVQTGKAPVGYVHQIEGDQLRALPSVSPHFLGIGEMLALGDKLELQVPTRVNILGVEVGDPFTVGGSLSPELEAAVPKILEKVTAVVLDAAA
ncbi:MAG TPA: hydrogenase maturation protease [Verrucomicrobiae bacterium]